MAIPSPGRSNKKESLQWNLTGLLFAPLLIIVLSWLLDNPDLRIILVLTLAAIAGSAIARFLYSFKSNRSLKRKIWSGFLASFTVLLVFLSIKWKSVSDKGGEVRQEPFRIAGNLYYVGTREMTSFLLTSPQGHVLIDGGYPGNTDMIIKNISILGFDIKDVKILLNSHAHIDHAGGLAALQKASGAELWISAPDAELIKSGGASSRNPGLMNFLVFIGLAKYPAPRIDHLFKDGAKIRLGPIELTAHITPGHTPGCTTWTFPVTDGNKKLLVVSIGSLTLLPNSYSEKNTMLNFRKNSIKASKHCEVYPQIYFCHHTPAFLTWPLN